MSARDTFLLRYFSRLSVRSMTMTRIGKPSAVTAKIFQNSPNT
jgi:hypothetical protein